MVHSTAKLQYVSQDFLWPTAFKPLNEASCAMPATYPLGPGAVNELSTAEELSPVSSEAHMNPRPRSAERAKAALWAASVNHHSKTLPSATERQHRLPTSRKQHWVGNDIKAGKALGYQEAAEANQHFEPLTPWQGQSS